MTAGPMDLLAALMIPCPNMPFAAAAVIAADAEPLIKPVVPPSKVAAPMVRMSSSESSPSVMSLSIAR